MSSQMLLKIVHILDYIILISILSFSAPFLDENGDIKSEIEFLEDRELVDCDFIDEEMLSMHNRYQDDTRDDEISFDSNRNTPTTYFEVVTGGTKPTFEDFSHVPRGSANRVISPNDSFTTAEEDLT